MIALVLLMMCSTGAAFGQETDPYAPARDIYNTPEVVPPGGYYMWPTGTVLCDENGCTANPYPMAGQVPGKTWKDAEPPVYRAPGYGW